MQAGASLAALREVWGITHGTSNVRISSLWGGDTGLYRRTTSLLQLSLRQLRYTEERPVSQLSLRQQPEGAALEA